VTPETATFLLGLVAGVFLTLFVGERLAQRRLRLERARNAYRRAEGAPRSLRSVPDTREPA
jgi:hypothetical protein